MPFRGTSLQRKMLVFYKVQDAKEELRRLGEIRWPDFSLRLCAGRLFLTMRKANYPIL